MRHFHFFCPNGQQYVVMWGETESGAYRKALNFANTVRGVRWMTFVQGPWQMEEVTHS